MFGAVRLTKNADLDKYKYSSYDIRFNSRSEFSGTYGNVGKNVIIFGIDNSFYVHIDGRNKSILVLGEEPTQGSDKDTIIAKINILINDFTEYIS